MGHRYGGRVKGVPNGVNADIRSMILQALHCVGGVKYLARQAEENPAPFMALLAKVMPREMASGGDDLLLHLEAAVAVSKRLALERQPPPPIINSTATETHHFDLLSQPLPTE